MEGLPGFLQLQELIETTLPLAADWLTNNAFVLTNIAQIIAIGVIFITARLLEPILERLLERLEKGRIKDRYLRQLITNLTSVTLPLASLILLWFFNHAIVLADWPDHIIRFVVSLLTAWVIIRVLSSLVGDAGWSRFLAVVAWAVAALNIVGLLDPAMVLLESLALNLGSFRLSLLGLMKAAAALALLLWAAGATSRLVERRLSLARQLSPSAQVLFGKLARIGLFTLAIVLGLNSVGIDLTAFTVFSGALGLGIGFGLQKVVANLISGMILLLDRSVKPGDVIALGTSVGYIKTLGARYVSVVTRDGIEHLIPNEELISQRVENWSYSDRLVRQRIPIGIDYSSDVQKAIELSVAAAEEVPRVLDNPKPVCHLNSFGDNAVNLELRIWIEDPQDGLSNVRSEILLKVWERFHEEGIDFPFPQRDLHVRSSVPLTVRVDKDQE